MKKLLRGARRYDLVVCAMKRGTELLNAAGIPAEWVHGGACDPEIHKRLEAERTYDIGFVGTDGGTPRKFYLQALRERYPKSYLWLAPHERMHTIYSRAKIGFNYCPTQDTLTMRCFEIMACGALLMLNDVPGNTHEAMGMRPGTHFVSYRSPSELVSLIDYYLAHEEERRRLAEAGYRETLAHHTYVHRIRRLGAIIARRLGGRFAEEFAWERPSAISSC
jgi:spore maturation protein CgeB